MIRRFGRPPENGRFYKRRHGVYVVIEEHGRVLLTFQGGEFQEFQLPGGGIDPGEAPLAALHREVTEETGWTIHAARRLGAFRRFTFMPEYDLWAEKLCTIYRAKPGRCLGPASEPDHEPVFVDPRTAFDLIDNDGDRFFLGRSLGLI